MITVGYFGGLRGLELTFLVASNRSQSGGRYVYLRGKFSDFHSVKGLLLPERARGELLWRG